MHQVQGASAAVCMQAMRSGFSSVMMDGSLKEDAKTPASYDYNIEGTRRVCDIAHPIGVSVEAGEARDEDGLGAERKLTHDMLLTYPVQAKDFVARTGGRCAGYCHRHKPWRV